MKTQENLRAPDHEKYQKRIKLRGRMVWADKELIPLLKAFNEVGLITRSHCSGHGENPAWVVIRMKNLYQVEMRNGGLYKELVLSWTPPKSCRAALRSKRRKK